jgi:hypothetical protein
MVSLWGSKKGEGEDEQNGDQSSTQRPATPRRSEERPSQEYEPDERTRLLPQQRRPPPHDGYLDPDDPAVSPKDTVKSCKNIY